jgi:hypothetical protein
MGKKHTDKFLVTLGPFYSTDPQTKQEKLEYKGCENITQGAFSPEQAVTILLRKMVSSDILERYCIVDEYLTALENRSDESRKDPLKVSVILKYKGMGFDMKNYPRLSEMRRTVFEKYSMKRPDVKKLRFGDLVLLYNKATNAPKLSDAIKAANDSEEEFADDLFPGCKKDVALDYISR